MANPVEQSRPTPKGKARVDLKKSDFDNLIWDKGYNVIHEKSIKCPCKTKDNDHLLTCENCQGTGWLFINPVDTKMVIQSINAETKYKNWSEEKLGTFAVTAMEVNLVGFMDRITINDSISVQAETLYPKINVPTNEPFVFTIYDISKIVDVFLFDTATTPLTRLIPEQDFDFFDNKIIFAPDTLPLENPVVSVRYEHKPQFHIIDLVKDVRNSYAINKSSGKDNSIVLPVHAIARRSHYVLDSPNYDGDNVIDNSYETGEPGTQCEQLLATLTSPQINQCILPTINFGMDSVWRNVTDDQKEDMIEQLDPEITWTTANDNLIISV